MIVNHGPQFPFTEFIYSGTLQTTHFDKVRHHTLNHDQSLLLLDFDRKKDERKDKLFCKNFWRTLRINPCDPPLRYKFKLNKTKRAMQQNEHDHSKIFVRGQWHDVVSYKMEQPHVFIGRGMHPLRGTCKFALRPRDITLNTFGEIRFVEPGFQNYMHEPNSQWSARWFDPITKQMKYTLIPKSSIDKYELARRLKRNLRKVHACNEKYLKRNTQCQQLALACHFIDVFGIRVGNEKDTSVTADTVGCCTLIKRIHVKIVDEKKRLVELDFAGKDCIRYHKKAVLKKPFFEALKRQFNRNGPLLFDRINPSKLNRYLNAILPGLTAKVFRTFRASNEFQSTLKRTNDLKLANLKAARICNHKSKSKDNLQTSRNNYIDPRIYFAYVNKNPQKKIQSWFKNMKWAQRASEFTF